MSIRLWKDEDIPEIALLLNQLSADLEEGEKEIIREENVHLNFQRMKDLSIINHSYILKIPILLVSFP